MKKLLLSISLLFSVAAIAQQRQFYGAVYSTGGNYSGANNTVEVAYYDAALQDSILIGAFQGNFSNAVEVDGVYAYVHIGRASGHPLGTDVLYKIDLITGTAVDSTATNVSGLQNIEIIEDQLVFNRGYGALSTDYLVVLDKNDLSNEIYSGGTFPSTTSGLAIKGDSVFISYTENDSGKVAVYNLSSGSPVFEETILYDTLASGMGDLLYTGSELIASNTKYVGWSVAYDALSFYDLSGAPTTDTSLTAGSLFYTNNDSLFGSFGGSLQAMDLQTQQYFNLYTPSSFQSVTGAQYEAEGDQVFLMETDYYSLGFLRVLDHSGNVVDSVATDFSGEALDLLYNHYESLNASYYNLNSSGFTIDFETAAVDNGDSITISNATIIASDHTPYDSIFISGSELTVIPKHSTSNDTIVVDYCDRFGDCYTDTIYTYYWSLSVDDVDNELNVNVYPNPTTGMVYIDAENVPFVKVVDLSGRIVMEQQKTNVLDLSALQTGVYLLQLESNDQSTVKRIIKK